jgi:hypothetical protein
VIRQDRYYHGAAVEPKFAHDLHNIITGWIINVDPEETIPVTADRGPIFTLNFPRLVRLSIEQGIHG